MISVIVSAPDLMWWSEHRAVLHQCSVVFTDPMLRWCPSRARAGWGMDIFGAFLNRNRTENFTGCKPISSSWSRAITKLTLVTTPLTCNGCNWLQLSQHTVAAVNCVIEELFHMVAMLLALLHPIAVRCQLSNTLELDPVKKG